MAEEIKGIAEETVTASQTAKALGSGLLDVYATPALVALLEKAAWTAVLSLLKEGETTVGTRMDVKHLAACKPGAKVRAYARLLSRTGGKLLFSVQAFQETADGDKLIGEGTHERYIVETERFLSKLQDERK